MTLANLKLPLLIRPPLVWAALTFWLLLFLSLSRSLQTSSLSPPSKLLTDIRYILLRSSLSGTVFSLFCSFHILPSFALPLLLRAQQKYIFRHLLSALSPRYSIYFLTRFQRNLLMARLIRAQLHLRHLFIFSAFLPDIRSKSSVVRNNIYTCGIE